MRFLNKLSKHSGRSRAGSGAHVLLARRAYQTKHSRVFGYSPSAGGDESSAESPLLSDAERLQRNQQANVFRFVEAHRELGHRYANINPVSTTDSAGLAVAAELNPATYGIQPDDVVDVKGLLGAQTNAAASVGNVSELGRVLADLYCGSTAVECGYVSDLEEREWIYAKYEEVKNTHLSNEEKKQIAQEMLRSQNFDNFLATKFSNVKRYGGEGAEAMISFFVELFRKSQTDGVKDIVLGMAHRGRLNLLTGLLQVPPVVLFQKMRGMPEFPADQYGAGDVLSHLTSSLDIGSTHVTMLPNPSHLEAVNPVAVGKVRGKHMTTTKGDYGSGQMGDDIICVQIHGDAALSGQGINQETLQVSKVPHYSVGGSIHLVINNQVGFTTPGERGRSSHHCTDLAKQIESPVIHVNGDHPEEVVKATRIAMEYRSKFRKDIFINIICFRRWGHNELDDPTFTNPSLYSVIHARGSVPDQYWDQLVTDGLANPEEKAQTISAHTELLNKNYGMIESYMPQRNNLSGNWTEMSEPTGNITEWDTGLDTSLLKFVGKQSVQYPDTFNVHPHLRKHHIEGRIKKMESGQNIDWGTAEALAIGSILYQGYNVRISGQDVGRATFSHRHAMLVDQASNEIYIPFNAMLPEQKGQLEIANSILSEEAVLGLEYGVSIESPNNLVIWEAQFGDFFNGAQIMLDTFVSNGESKWGLQSGLVMLLPHGMDGAGPEHSSCRIERFLQMSDCKEEGGDGDNVNWEVVHPTTAAQYFHLLRRQMVRNYRKPLVVIAPKVLLRLPAAASTIDQLSSGRTFQSVLADPNAGNPQSVEKVIFVSGRHYYTLAKHIQENGIQGVAVIRLEALCPFPAEKLQAEVKKYSNAKKFVWSQEEHRNMGCWSFVSPRFRAQLGVDLVYAGRSELCQPAVGVGQRHQAENAQVIDQTFS